MLRKPRVEYEGAAYHVMCRGDHGEPVYRDDADRLLFLDCLSESLWEDRLDDPCVRVDGQPLPPVDGDSPSEPGQRHALAARHLHQPIQRRHRLHGHVFAGSYRPLLIDPENDTYLLQVSTYIHLNPLRAGLVKPRRGGKPFGGAGVWATKVSAPG